MLYSKLQWFIYWSHGTHDDIMLKTDVGTCAEKATTQHTIMNKIRSPFVVALVLSAAVTPILYLMLPDNYVNTRYWIPSTPSQLNVHLHWSSDKGSSPVLRTQVSKQCSVSSMFASAVGRWHYYRINCKKLSSLKLLCYEQPSLKNSKKQGILSIPKHAARTE
jgi:hypothetical protein